MVFDAKFQNDVPSDIQDNAGNKKLVNEVSLFISKSTMSSEVNKTGSWRFARPVYMNKTAPCSVACPAGSDIPKIEMLVSRGLIKKAWETYLIENPFPSVCGRVCFHTCENACNRRGLDTPVAINSMDRFIGDTALADEMVSNLAPFAKNGRKVAIVGAGPAGLSCAWFLVRLGFSCEIFEARKEPGGVLRWGIPDYRLPKDILKKEIERIEKAGVVIHCRQIVTGKFIADLKKSHDALLIGSGLAESIKMNIPGEDFVEDGIEFLSNLQEMDSFHDDENNEKIEKIEGDVGVIGGGNTAIDVARSLIRSGAEPVILYRRRKEDMPAFAHEIEMAEKEGIKIFELMSPVSVKKENNRLKIEMQMMKTGPVADDGRTSVVSDGDLKQTFTFEKIYSGIGQKVKDSWSVPNGNSENVINFDHCSFVEEEIPVIFGGDIVNPVKSVTDAVASGKQAAIAIDTYFKQGLEKIKDVIDSSRAGQGTGPVSMELYTGGERQQRNFYVVSKDDINLDYFQLVTREYPGSLPAEKSKNTFNEIDKTLKHDQAMKEAERCFNCGFCNECDNCRIFCPEVSIRIEDDTRKINLDYCKGCGVCTVECPRSAMIMEEETI